MRILLIHQNFPGQFKRLAQVWAKQPGWQVLGLGRNIAPGLPDVQWGRYALHRSIGNGQHPYLRKMEDAVLHGQAVARSLIDLKRKGFYPDVILAHPGWGETLYARDVFPKARLVHFCEWYYGTPDSDMGFDPAYPSDFNAQARARTWNALHALNLTQCDLGVSPTAWQRSRHPEIFQPKIHLAHEGIDTNNLRPDANAQVRLPDGRTLSAGEPVITYVARNLEPYRGFPSFMRALAKVQEKNKRFQTIVVGGNDVSYGSKPSDAPTWREKMLREIPELDLDRIHFLGKVPYDVYRKVLQVSMAHVYLTYPFVLSWSMLEAMASGCLVIGSRTAPVQELIDHGANGLLVDFFDHLNIADSIAAVLETPKSFQSLRDQARTTVLDKYTLELGEKQYRNLIQA